MEWASRFDELASGRRRGIGASAQRTLLSVAAAPYALGVAVRNWRYDTGRAEIHRVAAPVVSVGNLTLGGTGKTPMVAWLARWYRDRGARVAIVSRGYGAELGQPNDEALELEERLPDVPHLQAPDRVAAARVAIDELDMQVILLDDGFQHRRLARDLDLVLLDAFAPWGYGHLFPRGRLRESPRNLGRAHVVVLSRADALSADQRRAIRDRVAQLAPTAVWAESRHRPARLVSVEQPPSGLEGLRGKKLAAFCGLGNPAGFRHSLAQCGGGVVAFREFPDHHRYTRDDIASLDAWARHSGGEAVVCTCKDLVKVGLGQLGGWPLFALQIDLEFLSGSDAVEQCLARTLPKGEA